jgi:X-Pro dipeptidyl-peptidase (S15 family)
MICGRVYLNLRKSILVSLLPLLALGMCPSGEAQGSDTQRNEGQPASIPMRDGVVLRADVLFPSGNGPFPVLVYRTPYGEKNAQGEYTTFQHARERGYAVVVQDVRGRYGSGGVFVPYQNEGRDGYDTIEWAAKQPWSNGKVGTFGLSYPGAVQWLAAVEGPPIWQPWFLPWFSRHIAISSMRGAPSIYRGSSGFGTTSHPICG